jgi:DNA-binding beta-propeller fold protein YncE
LLGTLIAAAALAAGPPGSLTPVAGPAGCVVPAQGSPGTSCTQVRHLGLTAALVSPDGRSLYTLGGIDTRSVLTVMRRDPRTGAVRQLAGRSGCFLADWTGHTRMRSCTPAHLNNPKAFAITPDGRELVYLNAAGRYPLNVAKRSARTGALTLTPCCARVRGVACASGVATSPDGRNVYVVSSTCTGHGLSILRRDPASGRLTQPAGAAGCIQRIAADGCARAPEKTFGPWDLAVTPDGAEVYASGHGFFVFARNAATGTLRSRECFVTPKPPCRGLSELAASGLESFAVAPDGRNLYLFTSRKLVVLARGPSGRLTPLPSPQGCVTRTGNAGHCTAAPGLPEDAFWLVLSPDGRTLYAPTEVGIVVLRRDRSDGSLTQLPGRYGRVRLGEQSPSIVVSPDGRFVYAFTTIRKTGAYGLRIFRRAR